MFRSIVTAAAFAGAAFAIPALAEQAPRTEVRYADLDLATVEGAAALKTRVARAAKRVCAITNAPPSLDNAAHSQACAKQAFIKALPQVELALAQAGTQMASNGRVSVAAH